jgi:hypothetical protein
MVGPTPTDLLDLAMNAEPHDDPVQRRDDDRLEDERDRGGDVEMRRVLHEGLPGDRSRQHKRVQRKTLSSAYSRS